MNRRRRRGNGFIKTVLLTFVIVIAAVICTLKLIPGTGEPFRGSAAKVFSSTTKEVRFPAVMIEEEELLGRYYYTLLEESQKVVYKEVLQGVRRQQADIYLHANDSQKVNNVFLYVLNDFPELFWCDGGAEITTYNETQQTYALLKPNYQYTGVELDRRRQAVEQVVNECLAGAPSEGGEYEKIKYVYEYLVQRTDYDTQAPDNQNIYSVFGNWKSVCAGYAKATQYLLNRMGIFCTYVTGTAKTDLIPEGQPHAWNLVQCEGEYFNVDTTWGDPVFLQAGGESAQAAISYDYLCCNDEELSRTHTADPQVILPPCTSVGYNYYILNGGYYESYDSEQVREAMYASIDNQEPQITFKFADKASYQQARDEILGNLIKNAANYLCEQYGLEQVEYSYQEGNSLNKLVIYWNYGV